MSTDVRKTAEQLARSLADGEGFVFKSFSVDEIGPYHPNDADWNYKDIPHARFVHDTIEGYHSFVGDPVMTLVMILQLGPVKLPLTMALYASTPDRQTYHTTYGPFVMIVETRWQAEGPEQTRVTTTYRLGGQPVLLALAFPLVKRITLRNYRVLMNDDLPMRKRRGDLRRRGYGFVREGEHGAYSYVATLNVMADHIEVPRNDGFALRTDIAELPNGRLLHVGDDAAYGFQVVRSNGALHIYPRLCPHEGACLDAAAPADGRVTCPWHGRKFTPTVLELRDGAEAQCGTLRLRVEGSQLVAQAEG